MVRRAREALRRVPLFHVFQRLYRKFHRPVTRHPLQKTKTSTQYPLRRLGSDYGGWTFVDDPALHGGSIISAGLGEDASFDLEFCESYDAKIIMVDPTPRAIAHFSSIIDNIGKGRVRKYRADGEQPVGAYELRGVQADNLVLVEKALWNDATILKFYEPDNSRHVSHSIVQPRGHGDNAPHKEVQAITVTDLLRTIGLEPQEIQLIKLDIEGAEIEVISDLLDRRIRPKQILVELNDLNDPVSPDLRRVDFISAKLADNGYECVYTDGKADFLFVLK